MSYLNKTLEQAHLQNKHSLIMGDFNIDLLNSCQQSDDFINTLGSFFYQPHILQPTSRARAASFRVGGGGGGLKDK